jgi:hypothetical protein
MSNLLKFPGQLRPQSLPLRDELIALELELVRLHISRIRGEIRQTNIFLFWYCLKRVLLWGFLFWLLTTFAGAAQAQTRSYYNSSGSFAGSSGTRGTTSNFYGSTGAFAGSATRQGRWTNLYDAQGRYAGTSIGTSPRR